MPFKAKFKERSMNEMCNLCKEKGNDGYCSNIGIQTDDTDIEITFCGEFKLKEDQNEV